MCSVCVHRTVTGLGKWSTRAECHLSPGTNGSTLTAQLLGVSQHVPRPWLQLVGINTGTCLFFRGADFLQHWVLPLPRGCLLPEAIGVC